MMHAQRSILFAAVLLLAPLVASAPAPAPSHIPAADRAIAARAAATPAPVVMRAPGPNASPNDLYEFYAPIQEAAREDLSSPSHVRPAKWAKFQGVEAKLRNIVLGERALTPTPVKRADSANVPLSQLPAPTFPATYASCPKCEAGYPNISSCMGAAAVFANATSIFNDPYSYIQVIKCACTDTFQSFYPQCVDCFQHTNQCWWLGTDAAGTGAGSLVTNVRQICGFGSALLGGVAAANSANGTVTVSTPGTFTDVPTSALYGGYNDQSSGPIFGGGASSLLPHLMSTWIVAGIIAGLPMLL